jgi:hypothetical protein
LPEKKIKRKKPTNNAVFNYCSPIRHCQDFFAAGDRMGERGSPAAEGSLNPKEQGGWSQGVPEAHPGAP